MWSNWIQGYSRWGSFTAWIDHIINSTGHSYDNIYWCTVTINAFQSIYIQGRLWAHKVATLHVLLKLAAQDSTEADGKYWKFKKRQI